MATFTTALKDVLKLDPTIESDILGSYELFDESHRDALNRKILNHYWNQEIGQETISLFRLALRRKMDEIMPVYNQHYEISAIKFNQLETIKITNQNRFKANNASEGSGDSESTSNAKSRAVAQELPQTMLSGNGDYATSAQDNVSDTGATGKSSEKSSSTQEQETDNTTVGYQGNPAALLLQYRQSLVNVDMMIIEELRTLFMLIWNNGDEYTERTRFDHIYGLPL